MYELHVLRHGAVRPRCLRPGVRSEDVWRLLPQWELLSRNEQRGLWVGWRHLLRVRHELQHR